MGYMHRARTHAEKVENALKSTANSKAFAKHRAKIIQKVIHKLSDLGEVSEKNLVTSLSAIQVSETLFLTYFDNLKELDKEIQKTSWENLLTRLRRVIIGATAPEVLFTIADEYEKYALDNIFLFEYVISGGRYNDLGQRYFRQLVYLIKIVLLSNEVQKSAADILSKNFVEVMHGVTLLEVDRRKGNITRPEKSGRELLVNYISNIF